LKNNLFLTIIFTICLVLILAGSASAANKTVHPGTDTIKNAISTSTNGDTLNLVSGTYNDHNIVITNNLTIRGPTTRGTPTAVIDIHNLGRFVTVNSDSKLIMEYLLIKNGNASVSVGSDGGAIYNYGMLYLKHCTVINNIASYSAGGIYNKGSINIKDSIINNNKAASNGGGICNSGTALILMSKLQNNTAQSYGGAINNENTLIITQSKFQCNTANSGGAIVNQKLLTISRSEFQKNTAKGFGGALFVYSSESTLIHNCLFYYNHADYGGTLYKFLKGKLTIRNSKFQFNNATWGGAIYNGNNITIYNSCLINNSAKWGGAIYNSYSGVLNVTSCVIESNSADVGSVLYNLGISILNFNQIIGNIPKSNQIYLDEGYVDANLNWWGSNLNPSIYMNSGVNATTWMVLHLTSTLNYIQKGCTCRLTANLRFDNLNNYHDQSVHLPDSILVIFKGSHGYFNPRFSHLFNGIAKSNFKAEYVGKGFLSAFVDDQKVNISITVLSRPKLDHK
jgi:hypothetical protein